uniref:EGF-like domain-containing protein n=1 Tax=Macrostomum lignano TaxID=282301 RepID=A0A1I8IDN6_9PLAT
MAGLFGLTKIDTHRGEIRIPVLTASARPSVRRLLQGLLHGEFESGLTLDLDSQVRARYAYWDTWMRTIFYRTFNKTVNKCNLGRTNQVLVKSLEDDVSCVCRPDFTGEHCTVNLTGCESNAGTRKSDTIKMGNSACFVQALQPESERNVCFNAFSGSDAPVVPHIPYTCGCRGKSQPDTSLPFENCLKESSACKNVFCGEGICTDTPNGGWRCLCK